MKNLRYIIFLMNYSLFLFSNALPPKKLPNGNSKTYKPNLTSPRNDLRLLTTSETNIISKNWLENIVVYVANQKKKENKLNLLEYEDLHIVTSIHKLGASIDRTNRQSYKTWADLYSKYSDTLYFGWMPMSLQGFQDILFLATIDIKKNVDNPDLPLFSVTNIIQSPYWDDQQISSIYLKNSLLDQMKDVNPNIELSFSELYNESIRYHLSWKIWNLEI